MRLPSTSAHSAEQRTPPSSLIRLSFLAIILLAFLLRTWDLDRLPPGLFFDEAYNGIDANRVIAGIARPLFFAGNNGREPFFIYLQSAALAMFGASSYSLRIVAAFAGVLTVPVIAALARQLLGWAASAPALNFSQHRKLLAQAMLIAAAALSVSYWHMSLSRLGFRAILLPLFSALAVYYLARAWQLDRRRDLILAGIWLGLAQYTYVSARLLPLVIAGFVVIELLLSLHQKSTANYAARLANAGLMADAVDLQSGVAALAAHGWRTSTACHPLRHRRAGNRRNIDALGQTHARAGVDLGGSRPDQWDVDGVQLFQPVGAVANPEKRV